MPETSWLLRSSPAFRLMLATSWLAPAGWQERQAQAVAEAIGASPDWAEYIRLVDRHRTPALSWAALQRLPELEIPQPARQQLQKRSEASRRKVLSHSLQLAAVLKAFNRAGIPVMPLKGPLLSLELYGDVTLRQAKDLDLAVDTGDLPAAQACLQNIGWRMDSTWFPLTPRQWQSFLQHEHELTLVHAQAVGILELHWQNIWDAPGQSAARWDRSIPSLWQECGYRAMDPIDRVLYLCSHGGEHAWSRGKWMGDLARIYTLGLVDWEAVLDRARDTGQRWPLLAGLRLLNEAYGLPLPRFSGDPWKKLPASLVEVPLCTLVAAQDPAARGKLALLSELLRLARYHWLVLPHASWRRALSELAYRREDFRTLRLSDRLFWAYAPLRPFLWAWRWARSGRQQPPSGH
jgi:hypothetical protein